MMSENVRSENEYNLTEKEMLEEIAKIREELNQLKDLKSKSSRSKPKAKRKTTTRRKPVKRRTVKRKTTTRRK